MAKLKLIIISLLVLSCGSNCGVLVRGKNFRPFEENTLAQVTPGKTTAGEVTKSFGPPSQIVRLSNGNAYIYERSVDKVTGLWLVLITFGNYDTQYDRIVFFINDDDVVTHYGSTFKSGTASYGMPF